MRAAPKCDMLDQVATCARERKIESERGATENVFAPVSGERPSVKCHGQVTVSQLATGAARPSKCEVKRCSRFWNWDWFAPQGGIELIISRNTDSSRSGGPRSAAQPTLFLT